MTDDALDAIARWHRDGVAAALATVVRTTGSVPRPVGGKLAISAEGQLAGSVSGGCVEGDIARLAGEVIAEQRSRLVPYGISDELAMTVGLMCGGQIEVLIEPVTGKLAAQLDVVRSAEEAGHPVTRVMRLSESGGATARVEPGLPTVSRANEVADSWIPGPRVWIVGAGHVAEHTAIFAGACDMRVTVVDPRQLFVEQERLAGIRVLSGWPDVVLRDAELGSQDAIVVLSHDPKIDVPALTIALPSPAFYVGAIGSRTSQADRLRRLREAGLAETDLARLRAPIGLDLGGREPAEIALSIVAEIMAARYERPLGTEPRG